MIIKCSNCGLDIGSFNNKQEMLDFLTQEDLLYTIEGWEITDNSSLCRECLHYELLTAYEQQYLINRYRPITQ